MNGAVARNARLAGEHARRFTAGFDFRNAFAAGAVSAAGRIQKNARALGRVRNGRALRHVHRSVFGEKRNLTGHLLFPNFL